MAQHFSSISTRDWITTILLNGILSKTDLSFIHLYNEPSYREQVVHCTFSLADEIIKQSTDQTL